MCFSQSGFMKLKSCVVHIVFGWGRWEITSIWSHNVLSPLSPPSVNLHWNLKYPKFQTQKRRDFWTNPTTKIQNKNVPYKIWILLKISRWFFLYLYSNWNKSENSEILQKPEWKSFTNTCIWLSPSVIL
jgi:hypothetical protein